MTRRDLLAGTAALGLAAGASGLARAAAPQGQLTWAIHVSLAPTWFDPADTQALVTPVHGAVLRCNTNGMVKLDAGYAACARASPSQWRWPRTGSAAIS
jgi:hypothetical protein